MIKVVLKKEADFFNLAFLVNGEFDNGRRIDNSSFTIHKIYIAQ